MARRRTTGSVRKRESGQWQARLRDPATGRLVSLGTFHTKGEADRVLTLALADQARGAWVDPSRGRVTVDEYGKRWLADHPQLRPRTQELYEGLLRLHVFPGLGGVEIGKLTPSAVRRWYSGLVAKGRPGPTTVAKSYRLLHAICATAVADEMIVKNPCVIEGGGKERAPERSVVTAAEVWALADAVDQRFRAMVLLAGFVGLRKGELFGLTRARVDLLHGLITVAEQYQQLKDGRLVLGPPKTEAGRRTLAVPPPLVAEIEAHLATFAGPGPDGLVFPGEKGGPLRPHVWQAKWDAARRSMGLPGLHFHDLRHVANTLTAASGASTKELMHRMGHASSAAALRYQHATRDRDAAIAATLGELIVPKVAEITELHPDADAGEQQR